MKDNFYTRTLHPTIACTPTPPLNSFVPPVPSPALLRIHTHTCVHTYVTLLSHTIPYHTKLHYITLHHTTPHYPLHHTTPHLRPLGDGVLSRCVWTAWPPSVQHAGCDSNTLSAKHLEVRTCALWRTYVMYVVFRSTYVCAFWRMCMYLSVEVTKIIERIIDIVNAEFNTYISPQNADFPRAWLWAATYPPSHIW